MPLQTKNESIMTSLAPKLQLPKIMPARDEHCDGIIDLIGACYSDYAGCYLDPRSEIPVIKKLARHYQDANGRLWVAMEGHRVVGCIGYKASAQADGVEVQKLYTDKNYRGTGLGARLLDLVEDQAATQRAAFIDLWSDTRFTTAHKFYEKHGYMKQLRLRALPDVSNTIEYYFSKKL